MSFDQLRRRDFITLLGSAAAWPVAARAQQIAGRSARIGVLGGGLDNPVTAPAYQQFLDELKKSGFSEGRNLVVELIRTDRDAQQIFAETAGLAHSGVDVLVPTGPEIALQAALAASRSIPIVFWAANYDPIALGYVASLARPGGNITGIVSLQTELAAKQVELLTQAFPEKTRLAILWDRDSADQFDAAEREAGLLKLDVQSLKLENPPYNFDAAFTGLTKASPQMLLVLSSPFFARYGAYIAELANQRRLPAMFIFKSYVAAGGLISYGVEPQTIYRRLASYVVKILNGARPADLPVEQAAYFELVVNLKTAKAIRVEMPPSILVRADEVIG
jgi:putative ABC transport system substrate-binding protein